MDAYKEKLYDVFCPTSSSLSLLTCTSRLISSRQHSPTETTGLDLDIRYCQRQLQLLTDNLCLCVSTQFDQTFMKTMQCPDIVWMMMCSR